MSETILPDEPKKEPKVDYMQEIREKGLNNFYANVPGGYRRNGFQKMPDEERIAFLAKKDPKRLKGKSLGEYWGEIDKTLEALSLDKDMIETLQEQIRTKQGKERGEALKTLNSLLTPAYIRLREEDYTQLDLWS